MFSEPNLDGYKSFFFIGFKKNMIDDANISARSRWPLDKNAPYMKGPGLKF